MMWIREWDAIAIDKGAYLGYCRDRSAGFKAGIERERLVFLKLRRMAWGLMLGDLLLTLLALVMADILRVQMPLGRPLGSTTSYLELPILLFVVAIWPLVFQALSMYRLGDTSSWVGEGRQLLVAVGTAVFAFAGSLYFTYRDVPRLMVVYFAVLDLGLLAIWRLLVGAGVQFLQKRGRAFSRVLVAGGGEGLERLALAFHNGNAVPGVRLVGVATDEPVQALEEEGVLRLGRPEDVPNLLRMIKVDEVILAFPAADYERAEDLAYELLPQPLRVRMAPDFLRLVVARSSVESLGGIPLIGLREPAVQGMNWAVKRVFDLAASFVLLILLSPLLLLIGLLIRIDSPGSVLFRQRRVGENGRVFTIYKFRTMAAGSDNLPKVVPDEEGNRVFKLPDDPRITRIGRFLRKTSLDELPNLINVFRGEMSIVGPRPELLPIADTYEPWQRTRLAVLPGMTGWWQVSGRSDKPLHLNTEYDLYYVRNYSLWLDLKILFKTVGAVLLGKGAY